MAKRIVAEKTKTKDFMSEKYLNETRGASELYFMGASLDEEWCEV
jgi:hypothetical protein